MQNGHAVKLAQQVLTTNLGPILQMPAGYAAIVTNIEIVNTWRYQHDFLVNQRRFFGFENRVD